MKAISSPFETAGGKNEGRICLMSNELQMALTWSTPKRREKVRLRSLPRFGGLHVEKLLL